MLYMPHTILLCMPHRHVTHLIYTGCSLMPHLLFRWGVSGDLVVLF